MPTLRLFRRAAAGLVLLALPAAISCDSSTAPEDFAHRYILVQLDSRALPASPFEGAGTTIVSDTLRMRAEGTGERVVWYTLGNSKALHRTRDLFTWRAFGDSLEVSFPCDDRALMLCIAPPHLAGRIQTGMQWVIPRARIYNGAPAVYQPDGVR